jgi:hypothetical protein
MKLNLQGIEVKAARVLVGMKGHRASGKNACVGAALKGKTFAKPAAGQGGRNNVAIRQAFYDAAKSCGFNIKKKRPG